MTELKSFAKIGGLFLKFHKIFGMQLQKGLVD